MDGVSIIMCMALLVYGVIGVSLVKRVERLEQNESDIVKNLVRVSNSAGQIASLIDALAKMPR